MKHLMVLLRRLLAIVIDSFLIALLVLPFYLVTFMGIMKWTHNKTILLIIFITLYFSLFEWLGGGQTPGLRALGLKVRRTDNTRLSYYETFFRNGLIFVVPYVCNLLVQIVILLFFFPDPWPGRITSAIYLGSILIWPISIIASRGRLSLSDAIVGTAVVPTESESSYHGVKRSTFIIITCLATLCFSIIAPYYDSIFESFTSQFKGPIIVEQSNEVPSPVAKALTLSFVKSYSVDAKIIDGHLYLRSKVMMSSVEMNSSIPKYSFHDSPYHDFLGDTLPTQIFPSYLHFDIPMKLRGFTREDFKVLLAKNLALYATREGASDRSFFTYRFSYDCDLPFISLGLEDRRVGFFFTRDSVVTFNIYEPDGHFIYNFSFYLPFQEHPEDELIQ